MVSDLLPKYHYAKNGTFGVAYFFIASILRSTPIPGFSDTLMKLSFTQFPRRILQFPCTFYWYGNKIAIP